ncbi:hypothetical protein NQ315_004047 [Exocentrus adspersus]|uniref:Zinc carboxypeptidase A 1 n=1 Tax=Exocentrus adspersus TaxID=1586481 RepID=A0AAV8W6P0_9CUCU|nr:hypothetical protein NQ315_004047 [Exocentrus adspersus]
MTVDSIFWSKHRVPSKPIDVMVSPDGQDDFETTLSSYDLQFEVVNENVEENIQTQRNRIRSAARVDSGNVTFTEFMRHEEINAYLRQLETNYPDIVTTEVIGQSFEGRDLLTIRISSGGSNKPTIFGDAGIHAREWIAPSTVLYIINQLVEVPENSYLYQSVDWVFIPVANPDGYEYTHEVQRMWRKTRSPGTICYGADPNRNFGFHWSESGSSSWQCSDTYSGRSAFSEVETQALRDYLEAHSEDVKLYVAIHTYGNYILYPWSYANVVPDNAAELQIVGDLFNDAVYNYNGHNYTVGNSAVLMGTTAGCSDDFALGGLGINLAFTLELPGGSTSSFDPPATDILWIAEEAFEGFKAWHDYIQSTYVNNAVQNPTLSEAITDYENFKVYRVTPKSVDEAELIKSFENDIYFDFWTDMRAIDAPVDIMVHPETQDMFEDALQSYNVTYDILIENVQETIDKDTVVRTRASARVEAGSVTFTEFMRYDEITAYLAQLATNYPDTVKTEVVGRSFEGRDIMLIRISSGGTNKTTIFAEAAIHAREWIAPPVALYVINQLVENPENAYMYEDVDWAIIPVANPDGYEYTHTTTRLWRKTRTPGTICYGVDPNRNFDFNWSGTGSSTWQCDQTYVGWTPFSEPETQAIRDYTLAHKDEIKLYLAIHSQGQWMLYPWGHITDEPENSEELKTLGGLFRDAIYAVNGTEYTVGTTANVLYLASGISVDWARAAAGINISYTIELPGGGSAGFDIPAERIEGVVEETWEGFKVLLCVVFSYDVTRYKGYKLYKVVPKTYSQAQLLKEFENDENFDFWTDVRFLNTPVDIMISSQGQNKFNHVLKKENIDYSVLVEDLETYLEINNATPRTVRGNVTFLDFMRHDDINAYLEQLASNYPQLVNIEPIGKSFEGRNLLLIKISSGGTNKPLIYAEAAIHAREWIAPPVALYIINQLVENPENAYLYQDVDWAILPVVNPDGYEYSHTTARFWRKTRSPGTICHGVDGNRNFEAQWGANGASNWQCNENYRGREVFSEVETLAIRDYISTHKDNIKLFLDIHSYGRWLLYPYGYNDEEADNIEELKALGGLFNDAVHGVNGGNYTVVSFSSGLYYASGTSVDWVKELGIDLAYTLELPAGGTGFDPPAADIVPVVEETWEGIKAFHSYIQSKYKLYRVVPETDLQTEFISGFHSDDNFDFWSEVRLVNAPVDIMVAPVAQEAFETALNSEGIGYSTLIENVDEVIQEESRRQQRISRVARGNVSFTEFMRHDDILAYIDQIATDYPSIASTEIIGKSFEGRDLTIIKISSGGSDKPIIYIEAAIHAREWISPPVALYVINQLVENTENADMYRDVDWVILPVVNPDGYEYTHTDVRLWRKTRSPGTICDGVDANRNFDYQWMVIGASHWQCSDTYAGYTPFSEVETQTVRDYLLANRPNVKLFLDLHSYGQWLLYPWAYTSDPVDNIEELHALGDRVHDAISAVRGTNYTVGSSNAVLYASSGGSRDWTKAVAGIDIGYTVELPGGGSAGFNPDASEIEPVVTETWEGIKVFYEHIRDKYVK